MPKNSVTHRSGYSMPGTFANATREMNDLFDRLFETPSAGATRRNGYAAASIWEDDQRYHIELDLPGIVVDDLDVTVDDGNLLVTAKRNAVENRVYLQCDRSLDFIK